MAPSARNSTPKLGVVLDVCNNDPNIVTEDTDISDDELLSEYVKRRNNKRVSDASRENDTTEAKQRRRNKFEEAKTRRFKGKKYRSPNTNKVVAEKKVGPMCNFDNCAKYGRRCYSFSPEQRESIKSFYYSLGDLKKQRLYIVSLVKKYKVKRKTTPAGLSRREFSHTFELPCDGQKKKVCQIMFLNTLGITEKTFRTAIRKYKPPRSMEEDGRGGRQEVLRKKDTEKRELIKEHINSFVCGKEESLHHTLNVTVMHKMFLDKYKLKVSCSLYRKVFKELGLSFHHPSGTCQFHKQVTVENEE